jgi:LPS-assembly protein
VRNNSYYLIAIATSFLCLSATAAVNTFHKPVFDDWVADPVNKLCHGYYLEQPTPNLGPLTPSLPYQPITIVSEQAQFTAQGTSVLTGHVHLIDGTRQIFADIANIHRDANQLKAIDLIKAQGHVKIIEPGLRVDGTEAEVLPAEDTDTIENANFRIYERHARGEARRITICDKNKMILKNATYTTCNPFQNTWTLKATNINLNKKTGRGQARHARLYVKDIPIFYWPYIDFPIDDRRQTGFLYPTFGVTNRSGTELGTPFYWNIAPNYDATLTPRLYTKRGLELQGQFRYLLPNSQGELEGSFLPNDRAYRAFRQNALMNHPNIPIQDPRISALNTGNNREALRIKHTTAFNNHWFTNLQYHTVKDDNYFMDFGSNIGIASTNQLLQQGEILYYDPYWNMQTRLQQYQTLHPFDGPQSGDIYKKLPQIAVQNTYPDLPYGFQWELKGDFSHFLHKPNPFNGNAYTTGDRFQLCPALSWPIQQPAWFIKPKIQWNFLSYALHVGPPDLTTITPKSQLVLPILDLDAGLIFERNLTLKKETYIQTLEPRLYYLYVPFKNQTNLPNFDTAYNGFDYNQLYWDNRFTGLDRIGDANQVTTGLTSRFFHEKTGTELLSLTAGQIYYFQENRVTTCAPNDIQCIAQQLPNRKRHHSSLVGLLRYALHDTWTARANVEWDPYHKHTNKKTFSVQYHPNAFSVWNVGYQFLRSNPAELDPKTGLPKRLQQTDISSAWPLTERWRLLGRWHYDLQNKRSNDISLGIEQQGCCTAVRLFVSHFLRPYDANTQALTKRQYTNGIFFQFVFKGLAGVGSNKIDSTLNRMIPDYEWHNDRF